MRKPSIHKSDFRIPIQLKGKKPLRSKKYYPGGVVEPINPIGIEEIPTAPLDAVPTMNGSAQLQQVPHALKKPTPLGKIGGMVEGVVDVATDFFAPPKDTKMVGTQYQAPTMEFKGKATGAMLSTGNPYAIAAGVVTDAALMFVEQDKALKQWHSNMDNQQKDFERMKRQTQKSTRNYMAYQHGGAVEALPPTFRKVQQKEPMTSDEPFVFIRLGRMSDHTSGMHNESMDKSKSKSK